jgi:arylsulfatase
MMGYQTPNIDRLADQGALFTDWYGQQSCTAGRAAFISGSVPVRTGMTKVGMPGAPQGWQKTDVTMATVLWQGNVARSGRSTPRTFRAVLVPAHVSPT